MTNSDKTNHLCVDSSCWIAFLAGDSGWDVEMVATALAQERVVIAPVILAELFSSPNLDETLTHFLRALPRLDPARGYWERCGRTRALLKGLGYRPKLADALIAQSCIDYKTPLLTRDQDFRAFAAHTPLTLEIQEP